MSIADHLTLVPHYVANLLLVLLAVGLLRAVAGDTGMLVELAVVVVVVLVYPSLVRRLGVAPASWERSPEE